MISIITPCSRVANLARISVGIPDSVEWIVVYDTTDGPPTIRLGTGKEYFCPGGISGNPQRNYGVLQASGEYIYFLDDDNILHPDMIERVSTMLDGDNIVVFNQVDFHGALRLNSYNTIRGVGFVDNEIDNYQTPDFTIENANGWIAGLKETIRDNVNTLVKKVYSEITNGHYYTGGGYRGEKKKRNNNGIDKMFILYTCDWSTVFAYWQDKPSIMDDLEKVCYILDGKTLPEKTLRDALRGDKTDTASNPYMSVKLCQNGNTHFTLEEGTRELLNRYGPSGAVIGENIKIKVFER